MIAIKPVYLVMGSITLFMTISWAVRGFPTGKEPPIVVVRERPDPAKLDARNAEMAAAKKRETAASAQDAALNAVRMAAIGAATTYTAYPCNEDNKRQLVKALTTYVRAYLDKRDCFFPMFCNDRKMEMSAAAFSTPLDGDVRKALQGAFSQGGISSDDFPFGTQLAVRHFTWGADDDRPALCSANNG